MVTEPIDNNNKATLATLQTQVKGLESDYIELKGVVVALDTKLEHSFSSLRHQVESALNQLTNKLEERNKTPWSVIWTGAGVCVAMMGLIGSLVWMPIKEGQVQLQTTTADTAKTLGELIIHILPDKYVQQSQRKETVDLLNTTLDHLYKLQDELKTNYVNYREHERLIKQMDTADSVLRSQMVARQEHEQHWKSIDERDSELARQIVDLRNRVEGYFAKRVDSSTWTPRDELQRMEQDRNK